MIRTLSLIAALAATPATAQTRYADLAAVDRAVAQFTGAAQGAPGGAALPVDRRLRLAPCSMPLNLGWYGARRDTVEVVCPMAGGWKLYVPLVGMASTGAAVPVIAKGDAVMIVVSGEGFAVSQTGEALEAGAEGAWVKVRGQGEKAPILRARVLRPGAVGIDLP